MDQLGAGSVDALQGGLHGVRLPDEDGGPLCVCHALPFDVLDPGAVLGVGQTAGNKAGPLLHEVGRTGHRLQKILFRDALLELEGHGFDHVLGHGRSPVRLLSSPASTEQQLTRACQLSASSSRQCDDKTDIFANEAVTGFDRSVVATGENGVQWTTAGGC